MGKSTVNRTSNITKVCVQISCRKEDVSSVYLVLHLCLPEKKT